MCPDQFDSHRKSPHRFMGHRKHSIQSFHIWDSSVLHGQVPPASGQVITLPDQSVASRQNSDPSRTGTAHPVKSLEATKRASNLTRRCSGPATPAAELIRSTALDNSCVGVLLPHQVRAFCSEHLLLSLSSGRAVVSSTSDTRNQGRMRRQSSIHV